MIAIQGLVVIDDCYKGLVVIDECYCYRAGWLLMSVTGLGGY